MGEDVLRRTKRKSANKKVAEVKVDDKKRGRLWKIRGDERSKKKNKGLPE